MWINVSDQFKVICQFSVIFNFFCKMTLRVTKSNTKMLCAINGALINDNRIILNTYF